MRPVGDTTPPTGAADATCIIGAGAAGLTLAHALATRGRRVIIIEGGGEAPPDELEDVFRVDNLGIPHRGAHAGRFRAWGGSTTRWGGQLWPWEPHEFEGRPDLGLPGWPIPSNEITGRYAAAFALLGIPAGTLSVEAAARRGVHVPPLDRQTFALKYSAWLPWKLRNLGRSLGASLRARPNVEFHLRTTATALIPDATGRKAAGVRVRSADGAVRDIAATDVVVAAGAIETTRLLMSSAALGGLGAASTWLGRGFMDHLSVRIGRFHPADPEAFSRMFAPVFIGRVQHTPRVLLQPEVLRREGLLGAYGHWDVTLPPDSGLTFVRERLRAMQSGAGWRFSLADVRRAVGAAGDILGLARAVIVDRRRHFPRGAEINLRVDTEQRMDPESRIVAVGGADAFGMPRVAIDWRVSDLERRTVVRTAELLAAEFDRMGIGSLAEWADPFSADVPWGELKGDSFHMMGGTRMARTADEGVVDTDARVFGTENVYVAGASVFPSGGMANPTLTLIALALRLADRLASNP